MDTRKIHNVTQRLGALKEDEAMKLRGVQVPMKSPSMSGKEPVERGDGEPGDHQTNDAVGGRPARWHPALHPKGWRVTACASTCRQWADNWEVLQQRDTMSSDTAKDLMIAIRTEGQLRR